MDRWMDEQADTDILSNKGSANENLDIPTLSRSLPSSVSLSLSFSELVRENNIDLVGLLMHFALNFRTIEM